MSRSEPKQRDRSDRSDRERSERERERERERDRERPRGRRKPMDQQHGQGSADDPSYHGHSQHPPQHHTQHHPQHQHDKHMTHHSSSRHHPHSHNQQQYIDDSSSEEVVTHHHSRQHAHPHSHPHTHTHTHAHTSSHRRQGSHPRNQRRRVPAQAEEQSSTGEEDHGDPYLEPQHPHPHHSHHSHPQHSYPVTDYYSADGQPLGSYDDSNYYPHDDNNDVVYDDEYVGDGIYRDEYQDDENEIGYDDEQAPYRSRGGGGGDGDTEDTETRGTRLPRGENDDTSQTYNPDNLPLWVFLGGSCDPTTWRRDIAVPQLKQARIPFYNPQIDDWHPELIQNEARAKEECEMLLFVIDSKTRAIASMLEATEHIMRKRNVVLVILDVLEGTRIDGELVGARQLKDLNRARAFLCDIAARHQEHCDVFDQVQTAIQHIIDSYPGPPNKSTPCTPSHHAIAGTIIPPSLAVDTPTPTSTTTSISSSNTTSQAHAPSPSLSPSPVHSDSSTTPLMTAAGTTPLATPQAIQV